MSDDLVKALAGRQAVVNRLGAGKLRLGVEYLPEQIQRQKAAFGADRLEVLVAPGHAQFSLGNRTQARPALYNRAGVKPERRMKS